MEYTKPPKNIIKQIQPILKSNGLFPALESLSEENCKILVKWAEEYARIPINNVRGDTSYKLSSFDNSYMELALQIMALFTIPRNGDIGAYLSWGTTLNLPNWPKTLEELMVSFGKPTKGDNINKPYKNKVGSKSSGCMVMLGLILIVFCIIIIY